MFATRVSSCTCPSRPRSPCTSATRRPVSSRRCSRRRRRSSPRCRRQWSGTQRRSFLRRGRDTRTPRHPRRSSRPRWSRGWPPGVPPNGVFGLPPPPPGGVPAVVKLHVGPLFRELRPGFADDTPIVGGPRLQRADRVLLELALFGAAKFEVARRRAAGLKWCRNRDRKGGPTGRRPRSASRSTTPPSRCSAAPCRMACPGGNGWNGT